MLIIKLIFVFVVFLIFLYVFKIGFDSYSLEYVKSNMDGNFHLVRKMEGKEEAADLIAQIKGRIKTLIKHLKSKYPEREDVMRLVDNFNPENIKETDITDPGTSYSVNKGSELSLCIRDKNDPKYKIHELNLIMFVVIHELGHIMSKSYGHNEEFGDNFLFLLEEANQAGVYSNEDYESSNRDYCGIKITNNPLM